MKYDDIRSELKTGDIVLFGGKGGISDLIKHFSGSKFSHIGMILDLPEYNFKCVWESTTLSNIRDLDTGGMMKGVQLVPLSSRVESYDGNVSIRQLKGAELSDDHMKILMEFRDLIKGRPYERSQAELVKSLYDGPFGLNETDLSSVFCSELLAETYMMLGILNRDLSSNEYTPADFSDKKGLQLENGFYLDCEIEVEK